MKDYHVRYKLFRLIKDETITLETTKTNKRTRKIQHTEKRTCTRYLFGGLIKYVISYSNYNWEEDLPKQDVKVKSFK